MSTADNGVCLDCYSESHLIIWGCKQMKRETITGFSLRVFALCLLMLLFCACRGTVPDRPANYVSFPNENALHGYLIKPGEHAGLISAHRGGPMPGFPENALATFENALTFAPCLIECDVRSTRDGVLVLMHDREVDRTTSGSGPVDRMRFSQVRKLRLRDPSGRLTPYAVPTLEEALEWGRGRCVFTLDVKGNALYPVVTAAIHRHNAYGYAIVITYTHAQAIGVHRSNARVLISVSAGTTDSVRRLMRSGLPPGRMIAFVGIREPAPGVYAMLRKSGIPSILGTMNNLDRRARLRGDKVYRDLYRNGANILSTDHVGRVARALRGFSNDGASGLKRN